MEDELKNIAPDVFKQLPQKDSFKLPEGYFESFDGRVMDRIEAFGLTQQVPLKIVKRPAKRVSMGYMLMAAAAVFALVLAAVWFLKPASAEDRTTASIELSDEEIEAYLLENVQYLEVDQLAMIPEATENEYQTPTIQEKPPQQTNVPDEITPEDVEHLLNDMTEEELEEIL